MNIGYKLVKNNMAATAEKAPYLGMAVPVGSLAYDNILKDMIKTGTRLSLPTARFFLEAFYEFAAERIAEEVVRINTGTVAIYPMIDGSFDSEDAEFDPERNSLYIGATLSQSLRDRVAGIVPDATGDETKGTVKMDRIYDIESQTRGVISGTNPFRISGRNLTVPDAEDESLGLYAKDGVTKVTDITVTETDEGQWIICQLSAAVGVPKGTYKVRLASHGLDPTDPLTVATLTVTLVEAIEPPVPGPEVKDVTYNDEPFEDGIDFHAEEYYAFDGTNVVYAEGDKMRVDQVVDGVRKTHDVEIFARPEHDSGIAYDPFSQAMNEKGFVRGADTTVTLTLHGGVAGTADQVISRSVKLYFNEG